MPTSSSNEFGTYTKEGQPDRIPLDQAEVNALIWAGYQPAASGAKKTTAKADADKA